MATKESYHQLMDIKQELRFGYQMAQAYPIYARKLHEWQKDRAHIFWVFYQQHGYRSNVARARIQLDEESLLPVLQMMKPEDKKFTDVHTL